MFAKRLQELREGRGLSQQDLAAILDTDRQRIYRYENGRNEPSGDIIVKIAQYFEVTTDYLFGLTDDPHGYQEVEELTGLERRLIAAMRGKSLSEVFAVLSALSEQTDKAVVTKKQPTL